MLLARQVCPLWCRSCVNHSHFKWDRRNASVAIPAIRLCARFVEIVEQKTTATAAEIPIREDLLQIFLRLFLFCRVRYFLYEIVVLEFVGIREEQDAPSR